MIHGEPLSCVRQPGRLPVFIDTNHYQPRPAEFKGYEAGAHNVLLILSVTLFLEVATVSGGSLKGDSYFWGMAFPIFEVRKRAHKKPCSVIKLHL